MRYLLRNESILDVSSFMTELDYEDYALSLFRQDKLDSFIDTNISIEKQKNTQAIFLEDALSSLNPNISEDDFWDRGIAIP